MGIQLEFEQKPADLLIRVLGQYTLEQACQSFLRGLEVIDAHQATKVLVDCRQLQGKPTILEYYTYPSFIASELTKPTNTGAIRRVRLAYVATRPLLSENHFGETVAINRGANLISGDNVEEAFQWLGVTVTDEV